jgi:hypothetical protein
MMHLTNRYLRLALLLLALSISGQTLAQGTLTIGRDQDSVFMDPILVNQNADVWILNNIHALLVRNNPEATDFVPDLA